MDTKFQADPSGSQVGEASTTKRRRAKGESGEGNYICGCQRVYLSYPALYTHIKTKHDGITPAGTTQPQTNSKSGRGRPKKGESGNKAKEEEDKDVHVETNENQQAYEGLFNYLKILEMENKYDEQGPDGSILTNHPDTFDLITKFPIDLFRQQQDFLPVFLELQAINQTKNIGIEEIDDETGVKQTKLNRIIAIFIYLIGRHLKERFYREFVFFLMMYRKALNELGWPLKEVLTRSFIPGDKKEMDFCELNNGELAPEISNDFITEKWPKYVTQFPIKNFKVLGGDIESTKNAVFLTQHFCNWLSLQGYTDSYLSINEEES